MKAWMVDDNNAEYGTSIVFAETRGKAISYALMWIDTFEDCSWTDMRAKRFPEYDQFYDGRSEVDFWYDDDHRVRLVRDSDGIVLILWTAIAKIVLQRNGANIGRIRRKKNDKGRSNDSIYNGLY